MSTGQQITDEEAAILRAWLGGHMLTDIAKARRIEHADVARVVVDTCGTDRNVARDWLDGGPRPDGKRRPLGRLPDSSPLRQAITSADPAAYWPPAPEPLARWRIHQCLDCSYLGPAAEHTSCAGELRPVVLILLPAEPEES